MDGLGQRGQVVGEAGSVADSLLVVRAHHNHGGISKRGRDDDPLGPSILYGGKGPGGLSNMLSTSLAPFDADGREAFR